MAMSGQGAAPRDIRALFHMGTTGGLTDEQLLEWFVARDREAAELAFAELVARHGPMVLRVCRTILRDPHEAEDAFQATFLILARRAGSIVKRASAASWLHGVARRVAWSARLATARRRTHERRAAELASRTCDDASGDDLAALLHEEIGRLPERYRTAIVLCDLEGLTEGQAAHRLGRPVGTVRSRLLRGRERLRDRLIRRGLAPSIIVLTSFHASEAASMVVPSVLVQSTTRAAVQFATAGTVPAAVLSLTEGILRTMFITKLKISAAALITVGAASLLAIATVGSLGQVQGPAAPRTGSPAAQPPPVSPRTRAILSMLDEPVAMNFANKTPLDDVLRYIKQATTTPTSSGLPIYVDPRGLQEAECSLNSLVTLDVAGIPLKVTLPQVLGQVGLAYIVKDDLLFISSPRGIDRERKEKESQGADDSPRTRALLAQLDQPVAMSFANETPLGDLIDYLTQATGIHILVHPRGLNDVKRSGDSIVTIDVDGVPLKTTLRLLLKQLGLAYIVRDGLLIISSTEGVRRFEAKAVSESKSKASGKD